jgi:hypothetical protein
MLEPRRLLLLELYRALHPAAPAARAAAASACASAWGLALELETAAEPALAARLAVRLVHQLEMQAAPLCVRLGPLDGSEGCDPALQAALAGAPLIAGREGRLLLAIGLDPAGRNWTDHGALVDSETCARIAIAGGELGVGADAVALLGLAGDLVPPIPLPRRRTQPPCVLVAALRLDVAAAARCLQKTGVRTVDRML